MLNFEEQKFVKQSEVESEKKPNPEEWKEFFGVQAEIAEAEERVEGLQKKQPEAKGKNMETANESKGGEEIAKNKYKELLELFKKDVNDPYLGEMLEKDPAAFSSEQKKIMQSVFEIAETYKKAVELFASSYEKWKPVSEKLKKLDKTIIETQTNYEKEMTTLQQRGNTLKELHKLRDEGAKLRSEEKQLKIETVGPWNDLKKIRVLLIESWVKIREAR